MPAAAAALQQMKNCARRCVLHPQRPKNSFMTKVHLPFRRYCLTSGVATVSPLSSMLLLHNYYYFCCLSIHHLVVCHGTSSLDCIEAGLPYDWTRLGIDSDKEHDIIRALLAATDGHQPGPSAAAAAAAAAATQATTGQDQMTALVPSARDQASDMSEGALPRGDVEHSAAPPSACVSKPQPTPPSLSSRPHVHHAVAAATAARGATSSDTVTAAGAPDTLGGCGDTDTQSQLELTSRLNRAHDGHAGNGHDQDVGSDGNGRSNNNSSKGGSPTPTGSAATGRGGEGASETGCGRWACVKLKAVKELAPDAEYWEIRMVLARIKSGWCGYEHLF